MVKWDYQILNQGDVENWMEILDTLKTLGQQEWELVAITEHLQSPNRQLWIFKKPIGSLDV